MFHDVSAEHKRSTQASATTRLRPQGAAAATLPARGYCQRSAARSFTISGMSFHRPSRRASATVSQVGW